MDHVTRHFGLEHLRKFGAVLATRFCSLLINHLHLNNNKSANALALCHPPSASFCSVLAGQWSSRILTHDRYNILSDILIEFEVNLGIIIEKYAKT